MIQSAHYILGGRTSRGVVIEKHLIEVVLEWRYPQKNCCICTASSFSMRVQYLWYFKYIYYLITDYAIRVQQTI